MPAPRKSITVDTYAEKYGIPKFDLLIDWGWFYFLTKPMFFALDFFYKLVGNFGVAILIVTLCIKLVLFPLANKSYVSMSKMKLLAPEMQRIKERYGDDTHAPAAGDDGAVQEGEGEPGFGVLADPGADPDLLRALQGAVRHHRDAARAVLRLDQGSVGARPDQHLQSVWAAPLDPHAAGISSMIGIWPLIMGVTMWVQMKLNPAPPDPVQQKMFAWMPVFFTFLLASFPAGLVIYWAWNNYAVGAPAIGDHGAPGRRDSAA